MLKKLVKYGNSNALIIDKAILDLLEIEEGATIKIKTDGKSLIITPHVTVTSAPVHETFTHEQASTEAWITEMFGKYKGLSDDDQKRLVREFSDVVKKQQRLTEELFKNPEFEKERCSIIERMDTCSPEEIVEAFKTLRYKFSPELRDAEQEVMNFEIKHKLSLKSTNEPAQMLTPKQQSELEAAFLTAHKKNQGIYQAYGHLQNSSEYQHQAQLIAEKFGADKNSAEFIQAMQALNNHYLPEYDKAQQELKAVLTKQARPGRGSKKAGS